MEFRCALLRRGFRLLFSTGRSGFIEIGAPIGNASNQWIHRQLRLIESSNELSDEQKNPEEATLGTSAKAEDPPPQIGRDIITFLAPPLTFAKDQWAHGK